MSKMEILYANLLTLAHSLLKAKEAIYDNPNPNEVTDALENYCLDNAMRMCACQADELLLAMKYIEDVPNISDKAEEFIDALVSQINKSIDRRYELKVVFDDDEVEDLFKAIFTEENSSIEA